MLIKKGESTDEDDGVGINNLSVPNPLLCNINNDDNPSSPPPPGATVPKVDDSHIADINHMIQMAAAKSSNHTQHTTTRNTDSSTLNNNSNVKQEIDNNDAKIESMECETFTNHVFVFTNLLHLHIIPKSNMCK